MTQLFSLLRRKYDTILSDLMKDTQSQLIEIDSKKLILCGYEKNFRLSCALKEDSHLRTCFDNIIQQLKINPHGKQFSLIIDGTYLRISCYLMKKNIFKFWQNDTLICLIQNITEQVREHHTLRTALNKQHSVNKTKIAFLSRMSHEFRTPLNAVIGFSDAIKNKLYGDIPTVYLEYINNINLAGIHLLDIVNDIMDVSAIESGKIKITPTLFSPVKSTENILKFVHSLLAKQKIIANLRHNLPEGYQILTDQNIFKRVMINIIGNATKYCPPYTHIDINIHKSHNDNTLNLHIRDYGKGFPDTVIDNFGMPFNIGENIYTHSRKSIGLGLSIIKSSITALDGHVHIYNHNSGGAVIDMMLPEKSQSGAYDLKEAS